MKPYTLEQQMARMGFPETETGPYVMELRALISRQLAEGMIYRSAGSHGDAWPTMSYEERAKAWLAWEWEINRRHSYRVEVIDGLTYWATDVKTMKRRFVVAWRRIFPWIGDRFREAMCKYRVWRDRHIKNPYL